VTEEMRNDLTPQGYIRRMFAETVDGIKYRRIPSCRSAVKNSGEGTGTINFNCSWL
jgi:hypothetical protein